eukprot:CAMPEP_0185793012 /NCGR_PEP_ID=MMETSP1174-20130828/159237_1 /TAXON_ID=35687 /ORGANISM="Dictyocha speculum, Strain CCMP1381" /LENGTH=396 /DNA_ID=CAMNT_0028488115 /DNA_START=552 /DNA_END=1742 /DNA_ORIENTATION=-
MHMADFLQCQPNVNVCRHRSERRIKANCNRPDFGDFYSTTWPGGLEVEFKECYTIENCDVVSSKNAITFDGLGHYMMRYVSAVEKDIRKGTVRSYKEMFRDSFRYNAIYLQGFSEMDGNWDLYCHERDAKVKFTADMDINERYTCYSTPNLDSWFNMPWLHSNYETSNASNSSSCLDIQFAATNRALFLSDQTDYSRLLKRSYWNAPQHTDNLVSCGQQVRNMSEFKVSIHLRTGDLLSGRTSYLRERLSDSLNGFFGALKYADNYIATNLPTSHSNRLLVVSDFPGNSSHSEVMQILTKFQGDPQKNINLRPIEGSKFQDDMSSVISFHTMLPHLPRLDLMLDANPLVSIHCMAQANLTIESSVSNFGLLAGALSSGRFVQPTRRNSHQSSWQIT